VETECRRRLLPGLGCPIPCSPHDGDIGLKLQGAVADWRSGLRPDTHEYRCIGPLPEFGFPIPLFSPMSGTWLKKHSSIYTRRSKYDELVTTAADSIQRSAKRSRRRPAEAPQSYNDYI